MPERSEEWEKAKKENLRYCLKHKQYYDVDSGCGLCLNERSEREKKMCPVCKERALVWDAHTSLYECVNKDCRLILSETEYVDSQIKFIFEEQE